MTSITVDELMTPGDIATALGEPIGRIRYIIESRRLTPVRRAGIVRMFSGEVVEAIRAEIQAMNQRRRVPA